MTTGEIFLVVMWGLIVFFMLVAALDWWMDQDGEDGNGP